MNRVYYKIKKGDLLSRIKNKTKKNQRAKQTLPV